MIKIAIVEDQIKDAEKLRECCDRYAEEKGLSFSIKTCGNGFDFMTSGDLDYDTIMLDIKMPYMNGLQTAKKIRESNENVVIVSSRACSSMPSMGMKYGQRTLF